MANEEKSVISVTSRSIGWSDDSQYTPHPGNFGHSEPAGRFKRGCWREAHLRYIDQRGLGYDTSNRKSSGNVFQGQFTVATDQRISVTGTKRLAIYIYIYIYTSTFFVINQGRLNLIK
jgi:hypothetical protein